MRTRVVAARAGVITLADTPSPPGSECYQGCPGQGGADLEQQACCSKCLYSANKVNVQHADGVISSYSHLDELVVAVGQKVRAGDLLGYSGTTGCSTGPAPALPDHVRLPRGLLPVAPDDLRRRRPSRPAATSPSPRTPATKIAIASSCYGM